jgi:hypothetical protein
VAVLRALEKNPDKRFLTANEFADALEKALPPNRNAPRVSRWRSARLIGGVSACATALVLIAWYWLPAAGWWSPDRATAALPPQRPLEQQIAELPCSTVHAIPDGAPGNYVLHGLIAEGEPLGALNAITAGAGALRIRRDIQTFPASTAACRLAEVLRPITDQPGATGVELSTPTGERRLLFGQPFQFDVRMPNYNGFLWVDYLDADHNASHFEINGDGLPLFHQANQPVALGRNENGKYRYVLDSGPYGRDLVIALVASEALPGSALPKDEAGEFYVMQLEADIREWQNRGIKISAAAMVLETVGPGAGR